MFCRDSQNRLSLAIVAARAVDIRLATLPAGDPLEKRLRNQPRGIDQVFAAAKDLHPFDLAWRAVMHSVFHEDLAGSVPVTGLRTAVW